MPYIAKKDLIAAYEAWFKLSREDPEGNWDEGEWEAKTAHEQAVEMAEFLIGLVELEKLTRSSMPTLNEIGDDAWDSAEANGWHDRREDEHGVMRQTSTFERLGLIHSEVSEAYEAFRKHGDIGWYEDGKPEGMECELADIIIRVCELATFFGYDLDKMVETKMAYNDHRPDVPARAGGKAI
jgi:hypothetical protein